MLRALASHASPLTAPSLTPRRTTRRAAAAAALLAATLPLLADSCSPSEGAARAQHATVAADSIVAAVAETAAATTATTAVVIDSGTGAVSGGPTPQGEPTLPSSISSRAARAPRQPVVRLSPLADTLADALVFAPRTQVWFTAATRNKRMLIDLGRVDADVKKTPERLAAYKEAVAARTSFPRDARFRLHGEWGVEEITIADYDVWNGRIVGVAQGSPQLDSIAKHAPATRPVAAAAELLPTPSYAAAGTDSTAPAESTTTTAPRESTTVAANTMATTPLPTRCVRDSASAPLAARAAEVRDSLDLVLRQTAMPPYEDVARTVTVQSSQVIGCFLPPASKTPAAGGGVRAASAASAPVTPARGLVLAVSLRDAEREFLHERVVHIDDATGAVTPLRVADLRFKAHDLLAAYDADGDGVDDLVAKGVAEASGATVVLRFDQKTKKFLRLSSGFAWESR